VRIVKIGRTSTRRSTRSWFWGAALVAAFALGLLVAQVPGLAAGGRSVLNALTHPGRVWAAAQARQRLDRLAIDLAFTDYQQLFPAATPSTPPACVPARVSTGAASLSVELCAPDGGAIPLGPAAAPFVLLAPEGDDVLGMARAVLVPADGAHALREAYLTSLEGTGVIVPARRWVDLAVNGSDWGVYGMEALPAVDMLTDHGLSPESAIVTFDDGELPGGISGGGFGYARPDVVRAVGGDGEGGDDPPLPAVTDAALAAVRALERSARAPSDHLDPDVWGAFLASDLLWCMSVTLPSPAAKAPPADARLSTARCAGLLPDWRHLRLAYDPRTGTLTPIATAVAWDAGYAPLPAAMIDDPLIARAWARRLRAITAPAFPETLLDQGEAAPGGRGLALIGDPDAFDAGWDRLAAQQARLRRLVTLEPAPVTSGRPDVTGGRPLHAEVAVEAETLLVYLDVASPFPLAIEGLALGEAGLAPLDAAWLDAGDAWVGGAEEPVLRGRLGAAPVTAVVRVPLAALPEALTGAAGEVQVVARVWGSDAAVRVPAAEGRPAAWGLGEGR
jgi:hypothetical protein